MAQSVVPFHAFRVLLRNPPTLAHILPQLSSARQEKNVTTELPKHKRGEFLFLSKILGGGHRAATIGHRAGNIFITLSFHCGKEYTGFAGT